MASKRLKSAAKSSLAAIPSVDRLLGAPEIAPLIAEHGRAPAAAALREIVASIRTGLAAGGPEPARFDIGSIADRASDFLRQRGAPSLRPVFNMTGTVLHTNLGRAPLAEEAIAAMAAVARGASSLEYDLERGRRGERDSHVEGLIRELTGAEAATVVNNNAAAVLLALNTFANKKEVPVSRGELIEIGGAFRMPDIMARAGARLVEIGTTNRTHARDYEGAITARTAMLMKVHCSNYRIEGFTATVGEAALAAIAHDRELPFLVDLGSGSLIDLSRYGLPREATVRETLDAGADLVTFSGDKLLGGPQAGLIAGRADLIARIGRNPLKRALRPGKTTLAALAATLALYRDPDRVAARLPALRLLARPVAELDALATRLLAPLAAALGEGASVEVQASRAEIGSGALPVETLESRAIVISPAGQRGRGSALSKLAAAFRALPVPVIGRVREDVLWLDLKTLEDADAFLAQLDRLQC